MQDDGHTTAQDNSGASKEGKARSINRSIPTELDVR